MSSIIGLGDFACQLANEFKKYPQYDVYNILVGTKRIYAKRAYIAPQDSPEAYEENCPSFKKLYKTKLSRDVLFIVDGTESISAASLRILSEIKGHNITILYIRSSSRTLTKSEVLNEKAIRGILQEYARSGLFEKIIFIDFELVGTILPETTIKAYYPNIRDMVSSTLHMIEVLSRSKSILGSHSTPHEASRILTIGLKDFETGEENMFFPIDYPREKNYFYAIGKEKIETDTTLLKKIKDQVDGEARDEVDASFGVYPTEYDSDYVYTVYRASAIQK